MAINETFTPANITPINISLVTDNQGQELTMVSEIFNQVTLGYGGLGILLTINFIFILLAYSEKGMNLNFAKSLLGSSFFTTVIGVIMFNYGFVPDYRHLAFFIVEFGVALILVREQKKVVTG